MSWGDVWGRSKHVWPASESRLPGPLLPAGVQEETATSSTGSGLRMPAQLPEVGAGQREALWGRESSQVQQGQLRQDVNRPAAGSPCPLQASTPQSMLGKHRDRKGSPGPEVLPKTFS